MNAYTLPAGTYYIGDPCYVLGRAKHQDWLDILEATNYFDGEVYEIEGLKLWAHGTAHGDGCYCDMDGNEYGVDAGLLGAIPIELVEDMKNAGECGHIHKFTEDFECSYDNGLLSFGGLVEIETDPSYRDED